MLRHERRSGGLLRSTGSSNALPAIGIWSALLAATLAFAPVADAACNVTVIAAGASSGGAWIGNVWTPSAGGSTVLASEVETHLGSGATSITTTCGAGTDAGDIVVNAAVTWADNTLTLSAANDITIEAELHGTGTASLVLEYGQGSTAAGNTSIYRIDVPAVLPANPDAPTTTPHFTTKRGSDGVPAGRAVPDCPVVSRGGVISRGCSFQEDADLAALVIRYGTVVIDGAEDTSIWIRVDGRNLFGQSLLNGTYFPYAWSCLGGQGTLMYPNNRLQADYFDTNGTITNLAGLESVTTTTRACKAWPDGPVLPFFASSDFPNGYYVRFVPDPDETGVAYQIMPMLFADEPTGNTSYVVVDYIVNVQADTPDAFTFVDQTGVPVSTVRESNAVAVSGLANPATVSVTGGEYEINGDGNWLTADGSVANGDQVRVRHTTSASYLTATDTTLTIAGVSDTFTSTTGPAPVAGSCGAAAGFATAFMPTSGLCSSGSASLMAAASPWRWTCAGSEGGPDAACIAPNQPLPGGRGVGRATISGGTWVVDLQNSAGFIPTSGAPKSPPDLPAGQIFPYDLFDFTLVGGAAGTSATITITYPGPVPSNARYWKYGPTASDPTPHWYVVPNVVFSGNTATLTIVDGGLGDDDRTANSVIVDQGGPGVGAFAAPALSTWGFVLAAGVLALIAGAAGRRRESRAASRSGVARRSVSAD